MDRQYILNGFQFDNDSISDDHVDSITAIKPNILIDDRQFDLLDEIDISQLQFTSETRLIDRLQQTRPKRSMYFDGSRDNLPS
jgi:hypothetical protein